MLGGADGLKQWPLNCCDMMALEVGQRDNKCNEYHFLRKANKSFCAMGLALILLTSSLSHFFIYSN